MMLSADQRRRRHISRFTSSSHLEHYSVYLSSMFECFTLLPFCLTCNHDDQITDESAADGLIRLVVCV